VEGVGMSLFNDVTKIKKLIEAEQVFKAASNDQLKARGTPEHEYSIWAGDYFDGVVSSKDIAISYAKEMATRHKNVRVYEVPIGSGMRLNVNGKMPVRVWPPLPEIVAEAKPIKPIFKPASAANLAKRAEIYNQAKKAQYGDWAEIARTELSQALGVNIVFSDYDYYEELGAVAMKSVEGKGSNDESEWIVFQNSDVAYDAAISRVKDDLENEPELFTQDWLQNYIEISDNDKSMIAQEEADAYLDGMDEETILEEAGVKDEYDEVQEQIDNLDSEAPDYDPSALEEQKAKILEDATETLRDKKFAEIEQALDDPIEYFVNEQGIYSKADLLKQNFISINVDDAATDAVDTDGVANFLDNYDGEELELPSGAIAYGTN
jgi:hypothetical protein